MSRSPTRTSTEPSRLTQARPEPDPHVLALPSSCNSTGSLRRPHRVWRLRRNWSTMMPCSRSLEALLDKTKATLKGKSRGTALQSQDHQKVQGLFFANTLPKSLSQGSFMSKSSDRGASLSLQESTALRLDAGAWRCHGSFTHCFLRKTNTGDGDDDDDEDFAVSSVSFSCRENLKADSKAEEQINMASAVKAMSLKERLAHVEAMKGKTYSLHTGFTLARKDALEMVGVLRSSIGDLCNDEKQEVNEADMETFSQLLLMQAKVLKSACSQMAEEYSSPEELLLTLTHSFHTLCCLTQACMSLVEGLSTESQQIAMVAKVDEVMINYVCLLEAAEAASGSSPSDQSVKALTYHSATMSAILHSLTHSLKTLFNK